jgi:hypothetical protein
LKPRDAIIVLAVVLIAGFAAADAIRGHADSAVPETTSQQEVQTGPTRLPGPQPRPNPPAGWPVGRLRGSLVFTDARDCRVRVIGLAGGVERPLSRFAGNCELWAPPASSRVAYGLGPTTPDGFAPFKIADLALPDRDLGGFRALFGVVLWSPDGQHVAWCGRRRTGFDLEVGGAARRLPTCPVAFTQDDRVAYAIGKRLVVEGRTVLRARKGITYARFGTDGSVAIVENGDELVRYSADGRHKDIVVAPAGRTPILSPRNCAAVFRPLDGAGPMNFVALPCFHGRPPRDLVGTDASWSPDGRWLAVAGRDAIEFHPLTASTPPVRWPATAAALAWRVR